MATNDEHSTCQQPDHDNPKMKCGYPLPCPWHTVEIDGEAGRIMKIPPEPPDSNTLLRIAEVAKAIAERVPVPAPETSKAVRGDGVLTYDALSRAVMAPNDDETVQAHLHAAHKGAMLQRIADLADPDRLSKAEVRKVLDGPIPPTLDVHNVFAYIGWLRARLGLDVPAGKEPERREG